MYNMQNLICSKQYHIISGKFVNPLVKYNIRKHGIFNIVSKNISFNNERKRLCFPLLQWEHKILSEMQLLHTKNGILKIRYLPKLYNARSFSSTSINYRQSSNESNQNSNKAKIIMIIKLLTILSVVISMFVIIGLPVAVVDWNTFVHEILLKGYAEEIRITPQSVFLKTKQIIFIDGKILYPNIKIIGISSTTEVEPKIRKLEKSIGIEAADGLPIVYDNADKHYALLLILSLWLLYLLSRVTSKKGNIGVKLNQFNVFGSMRSAKFTLVNPVSGKGVRFKDVAGLKEPKIEIMEFVDYLRNPGRYNKLGAKVPKGALLLGPPGCGKTLLAKAVATESNVPFLSMNGTEFIEMVTGLGAARIRDLFAEAKKRAPSIIYIDEIDAIGKKRSDATVQFSDSEADRTLNQLLVEMDGMTTAQDIIIMASTNRADTLDKALLRPGRFDRHILIDLPTLEEREQIFEYHLASLSLEGKPTQFSKYLAHLTPGFSGADIANVCNEAALHAASDKKVKVENDDLMYAIDKILGGSIKRSSTLTPSEKKVVVYHEAGRALATWLLKNVNPLLKVTVIPRTNKNLGFSQHYDRDIKLHTFEHLFERICVLLAGRVAENIFFNKISTRAQNDLKKVTEIAYRQVQEFGMSPTVGLISFNKEVTSTKRKKPYSKKLGSIMDAEVRRIITEAYVKTEKLLSDNKDKLIILAEALLKKETLTYNDIEALIGPPQCGKNIADLKECTIGMK